MTEQTLNNFVSAFIVLSFGMILWISLERAVFTRFDGKLKRGIKTGSASLSVEQIAFLSQLRKSKWYDTRFIRVEGRERLLGAERSGLRPRWNNWAVVGYADLTQPQPRLEFRMQVSTVVSFLFFFPLTMVVIFGLFGFLYDLDAIRFLLVFAAFFLLISAISVGSYWFNSQRERRMIWGILDQGMNKRPGKQG